MSSRQQSIARRVAFENKTTGESSANKVDQTPAEDFDTTSSCSECDAKTFTRSPAGEWYCDSCGAIHTQTELKHSEPGWTPREQRRTGPTQSISRFSVGTRVGNDSSETAFWSRYNKRLNHKNRTLRHGLKELRALTSSLEANDTLTEQSAFLFRRVADDGFLVGHSVESMGAACLHVTAREHHVPFPLKQIADESPVSLEKIKNAVSRLLKEYDLQVAPPEPSVFLPRFASEAGLSSETRQCAYHIARAMAEDGKHIGQSPTGVAAAILYGAAKQCGEEVVQEDLASVAFVSVVTLSRQWQTVKSYLDGVENA
ncbi:transcription initiation factor IIB [Natranaeroarchaeum sulfidigenes]